MVQQLLEDAAHRAMRYLQELDGRGVAPAQSALERLPLLGGAWPEQPGDPLEVLSLLDEIGSPATVATAGRRFFGLVIGGSLPVTVAANWLATAWDQNAVFSTISPVAAALEEIALGWLVDIFRLPAGTGGASLGSPVSVLFHRAAKTQAWTSRTVPMAPSQIHSHVWRMPSREWPELPICVARPVSLATWATRRASRRLWVSGFSQ